MPGARSNRLDRLVVAVVGYLSGRKRRYVPAWVIGDQWPWPSCRPTAKGLRDAVRRMRERGVLEHCAGSYRVSSDLQFAAGNRGARFRWLAADIDSGLSAVAVDVLALLRGRAQGRSVPWADSVGCLAALLGSERRTVGRAIAELQRAGRLRQTGAHRLRTGATLPMFDVVDDLEIVAEEPVSQARERAPLDPPLEPPDPPREPLDPQSGDFVSVQASPGSSEPSRLRALPAPAERAARDRSRARGADDPKAVEIVLQRRNRVVAPWVRAEGLEQQGAAAQTCWGTWWRNCREAVAIVQQPVSGDRRAYADATHDVLAILGVLVLSKANAAGRAGVRRARRDLADRLVDRAGHPSVVLGWLYRQAQRIEREGKQPRQVAAALMATITPHAQTEARTACVELGRLAQPQIGRDPWPSAWSREVQSIEDRAMATACDLEVRRATNTCAVRVDATGERQVRSALDRLAALRGVAVGIRLAVRARDPRVPDAVQKLVSAGYSLPEIADAAGVAIASLTVNAAAQQRRALA